MATMCFESMSGCDFPHDYEDSFADTLKMPPLDESLLLNDNDMVGFEDLVFVGRKEQSIRGDVAKIAAERSSWMLDDLHDIIDIKPDIRNGDCMWSSFGSANTCNNNSSSNNGCNGANNSACNGGNSAASSYSESSAVPPAIVSCSGTMMIKHEMTEDDEDDVVDEDDNDDDDEEENCNSSNNNNSNNSNSNNTSSNICSNKLTTFATSARITIRPNKSATQMRYNNNNTTSYSSNNNVEQHIPPGASLLRKSNPSTAVSATALKLKQQYHSLNRRSSPKESSSTFVFPDPPQQDNSKEDASMAPVFRHNVDLAACLVGSNNISLTSSSEPNYHIDHISRELQNGKSRFDLYHSNYQPQISDVLDVISQQVTADAAAISASSSSGSSAAAATTSTTMSPPASNSDCDSDDGDCSMVDSNCGSSSYMRHISDHSYTRSEMETNLETPSDSDEEIDVVSLNDKTLPTNPSDRDRRALQTKVANKISTIPPPRRGRYELPYTPASSSPVKSEANSRFPSPSSTPYQNSGAAVATVYSPLLLRNTSSGSSSSSSSSSAGSDCATSTMLWEGSSSSSINNKSSRKRYQDTCRSSGAFSKQLQASKKSRAKLSNNSVLSTAHPGAQLKQQQHTLGANSSSSSSSASSNSANNSNVNFSVMKRQFSLDEADTIEKRNLHNDMERQRRIGLKNLFEALKKQIPNIRDKERAPKVNILREAAKLCEQLTNEERELSLKRQLLKAQLKQRQEKIARLRLSMNAAE